MTGTMLPHPGVPAIPWRLFSHSLALQPTPRAATRSGAF